MGVVYDVLASFTCPRTITFVDYRLGFTHKAIVVAIFAYVCFNLFHGQLYLVDSVPLGLISAWSTSEYSGNLGNASFATSATDLGGEEGPGPGSRNGAASPHPTPPAGSFASNARHPFM